MRSTEARGSVAARDDNPASTDLKLGELPT
jgi:hypothetical protein